MKALLRYGALVAFLALLAGAPASAQNLTVTITSSPVLTANAGDAYSYDVEAVSSNPLAVLAFTLREGPAGMTMDGASGLVSWSPAAAGMHRVRLRVKARAGNGVEAEAEQEYTLRVGAVGGGMVAGVVRDSAGAPLARIEVKLFDPAGFRRLHRTRTDSTGAYAFAGLAPGTYLAKADPADSSQWHDQWFDHVDKRDLATPLVLSANGTLTANFDLRARGAGMGDDVFFTMSGQVRGANGMPLAGAVVTLLRHGGMDDLVIHPRGGGDRFRNDDRAELIVRTDSTGSYSARVKAKTYIVRAAAAGYLPQFWDHAATLTAARRLSLVRDTTGISFDLAAAGGTADEPAPAGGLRQDAAQLEQNYPNPFNPSTSIRFAVPAAGRVRLQVFNAIGQEVAELVNGDLAAGVHAVEWNAGTAASGVYFTRLEFGGTTQVRRMQLVR